MSYTLQQQAPKWWAEDRKGLLDRVGISEEWSSKGNDEIEEKGYNNTIQSTQSEPTNTTSTSSREISGVLDSAAQESTDDASISSQIGSAKDKVDSFGRNINTYGTLGSALMPVTAPFLGGVMAITKAASMALGLGEAVAGSFESGWMGDLTDTRENENVKDDLEDYGMSYKDTAKIGKQGEMSSKDARQNVSDFDKANSKATSEMSKTEAIDAALGGFFGGLDDDSGNGGDSGSDNDSGGGFGDRGSEPGGMGGV